MVRHPQAHLLDLDQLAASFGRRLVQDDAFWLGNHGGLISDYDVNADGDRLEPIKALSRLYPSDVPGFVRAVWAEVTAMMRTLHGTDAVKMVCVDIDDNPVERAAVEAAPPQVRTLGAPHLDWRRTLLWAPETQVTRITGESSRRTDMIRAQGDRETARGAVERESFLAGLGLTVHLGVTQSTDAPTFSRAFELLNKMNQFNTTGQRWTQARAERHFADGGVWRTFTASDRFTAYGLVGVLVMREHVLSQIVMSCRVFGLGIEQAVLAALLDRAARSRPLVARLEQTERNAPCRSVFQEGGWRMRANSRWISPNTVKAPEHVALSIVG